MQGFKNLLYLKKRLYQNFYIVSKWILCNISIQNINDVYVKKSIEVKNDMDLKKSIILKKEIVYQISIENNNELKNSYL